MSISTVQPTITSDFLSELVQNKISSQTFKAELESLSSMSADIPPHKKCSQFDKEALNVYKNMFC